MSRLFYSTLNIKQHNPVLIMGEKSAYALSKILAEESVTDGHLAIILSLCERTYPIEGKVLVSPETELLMDLLKEEDPAVMYLARAVKNDLLQPFAVKQILHLLNQLKPPVQIFIMAPAEKNQQIKFFVDNSDALFMCTVNYARLEDELSAVIKSAATSDRRMIRKIAEMFERHCPFSHLPVDADRKGIFIDRVTNVLDENKMLSLLRKFRDSFPGQIFIGDILNYQIKKI